MMMGPTKKKVMTTGFICFLIPIIVCGVLFYMYNKKMEEKIASLEEQAVVTSRYVFARDMAAGEVITENDVKVVDVKGESAPKDSIKGDPSGEYTNLDKILNRRLMIDAEQKTIVTRSMLYEEAEDIPEKDLRLREFNMITMPSDLQEGDYVDLRVVLPTGADYLVTHGKEVVKVGTGTNTNTFYVKLNEEDNIRTTAAIIESYMQLGSEIYANKYVQPNVQLFDSKRVDLVELYQTTAEELKKEKQNAPQTTEQTDEFGYSPAPTKKNDEDMTVTASEIAARIGVDEKVILNIEELLNNNKNASELETYKSWLLKTPIKIEDTYPVNDAVVKLVKSNPNILEDLKAKYDIEKLEEQRASIPKLDLYKVTKDYDGNVTMEESDALKRIEDGLKAKIETQKAERKEYLQSLILKAN